MSVDVKLCGAGSVRRLRDDLCGIYQAAFGAPPYREDPGRAIRWCDEALPRHSQRDGFRCAVAELDGRIVGFAYGYIGHRGQWWTDRVAALAPPGIADRWLGGHFELVEMAVLPSRQRRGIGTALHDTLLAGLPDGAALLTTSREDTAARRLYLRRGWKVLVDDLDGESSLLGRRLSATTLRAAVRRQESTPSRLGVR